MNIDAKELPKILKACRDAKVTRLKMGDLEIEFAGDTANKIAQVNEPTPEPMSQTTLEAAKKDLDVRTNLAAIEEVIDGLHITDPELFEQLQLEKELESASEPAQH